MTNPTPTISAESSLRTLQPRTRTLICGQYQTKNQKTKTKEVNVKQRGGRGRWRRGVSGSDHPLHAVLVLGKQGGNGPGRRRRWFYVVGGRVWRSWSLGEPWECWRCVRVDDTSERRRRWRWMRKTSKGWVEEDSSTTGWFIRCKVGRG